MNKKRALRRCGVALWLLGAALQTGCIAQQNTNGAPQQRVPYVWRNVEINGGGFVSGIVFNPSERGLIYARTDIGGAYRWNVQTKRWIPLTDGFGADDWNLYGIESLASDPSDPNRAYAAVGTYTNDWAGNGAILRSDNRGDTWQRTDLPFKNGGNEPGRSMGERLIVSPHDSKTLFFGTRRSGLWKSSDFGATWQKISSFPAPDNENGSGISLLTFDAQNTLVAGVASNTANLFASRDNGVTWAPVAGAPQGLFPHHAVFASDGTLYISYSNGPGPNDITTGALWKRDVAGAWTNISPITPTTDDRFGFAGLSVDARDSRVVMVSTIDRWAKGDDIFRSTDGGATWKSLKAASRRDSSAAPYLNWGKPEVDLGHWIGDLEIDPFDSGHVLYVTGATVWGSDNADALDFNKSSNWSVRAAGIEEVSVSRLISPPVGPHLISGMRDIGGFVHDDLTASAPGGMMNTPRLSRNEGLDFAGQTPTVIVRTGNNDGGYSLDSGRTWTAFATKPAENMDQGPIAVGTDGATFVWSANYWQSKEGHTYFSRDRGATWTQSNGLPAKTTIISDRVTPGVFYCLDANAKKLLVSSDGGATFPPRDAPVPDGFSRIAASPHGAGDLWLTGRAGLLHSQDGGQSWTKVPLVGASEALGFGKAAPGANYEALFLAGNVGAVHGVFRSDDTGSTWTRINDDGHQWGNIGQSITGDPRVYGRVFIATNGRGIIWGEPRP